MVNTNHPLTFICTKDYSYANFCVKLKSNLKESTFMQFDYVIIGAGSAGCVIANKLSMDGKNSVVLLEAGPDDTALSLKMPAAVLSNLKSTKHNWAFKGEPEPHLNGRSIQHDRGKTIGGSSSINGMLYIRGHAMDFDGWRQSGCEGWGYDDVLPYFKRMENYDAGADAFRGSGGPLNVQRSFLNNPLLKAFIAAGQEAGYPLSDDLSGYRQEGFGVLDSTVYKGERWSAARAYLDPVRKNKNLRIVTRAHVQKVHFAGLVAKSVSFIDQFGRQQSFSATKEIILCAGAVGTPHLLMVSGIGPRAHLEQHGIDVIADLSGVGQNLNEHPDFVLKYKCKEPVTLWPKTKLWNKALIGAQWFLNRTGVVASNHFEVVACIRSDKGVEYPDLQLTLSPIAVDDATWAPLQEHAFQIHIGLMRAQSRGRIELRSKNPMDPPKIFVNYLENPRDRDTFRKGIALVRELVKQPSLAKFTGQEIFPGNDVQDTESLDACLRDHVATQWHLSCTARMGTVTDKGAVVDPQGRVHGIDKLRIADASIMPMVTNGNTNSPTIMIAEKLSDHILGKPALPRIELDVWKHPSFETEQR